ncbi:MAG TPA: SGNH/GDSL hydrolase family protein [Bryobacteraceae bacterium]
MVVVGDSLSAGFQNFSLFDQGTFAGQRNGFAALVAQQAGANVTLPLISYPGLPPALYIDPSTGHILQNTTVGARTNPGVQAYNLSVPGFTLENILAYSVNTAQPIVNPIDGLALSILATPATPTPCGVVADSPSGEVTMSEVVCALKLNPHTILASAGNNDALQSLTTGTPPTDPLTFTLSYAAFLGTLSTTRAKIVLGNIPDVTALPFLIPASAFLQACGSLPSGMTSADYVVPNITAPIIGPFNICQDYAIRKASLITQTRNAIKLYNTIIKEQASVFGAVVVDVNSVLGNIAQHGYKVNNVTLTTMAGGGLFSLDDIHPTNTGYAILANAYIDAMNAKLGTSIPEVSVAAIEAVDPLAPH